MATLLPRIRAEGATALYDALIMAIEQVNDKTKKTIMTVLTDGEDNSSRNTLEQVMTLLKEYPAITLHIVHIDTVGARLAAYEQLCRDRGDYVVINDTMLDENVLRLKY